MRIPSRVASLQDRVLPPFSTQILAPKNLWGMSHEGIQKVRGCAICPY